MASNRPVDMNNLVANLREALAAESPIATESCLNLGQILDAIEAVDAGDEPDALAHIAMCAHCANEYLSLRETFSEADTLRLAGKAVATPTPARRNVLESFGTWLSAPFRVPRLRVGLAGATVFAAAVVGYVIGAGSMDRTPDRMPAVSAVPSASQPDPEIRARMDRLNADLDRARAENRRLQRLAARPPVPPIPRPPQAVSRPPVRVPVPMKGIAPVMRSVAAFGRPLLSIVAPPDLIERGNGASTVVSPAGTWVLSDRPVFRCRFPGAGPDTRYSIKLEAPSGGTLTAEKAGPALEWQPAYRLPRGGKMTWTVSARVGDSDYSATGRFGVLTDDEARRVQQAAARVKGLERARVYHRAGLLNEAAAVLEKVASSSRDYPAAERELVEIRKAIQPQVEWVRLEDPDPAMEELSPPSAP